MSASLAVRWWRAAVAGSGRSGICVMRRATLAATSRRSRSAPRKARCIGQPSIMTLSAAQTSGAKCSPRLARLRRTHSPAASQTT